MKQSLYSPVKIGKVCPECGFKHQENRTAGIFVPREFNGGRYDDDTLIRNANSSPVTSERTAHDEHSSSEEKARRSAKSFVVRQGSPKNTKRGNNDNKLHRPMTPAEFKTDQLERHRLGDVARRYATPQFVRDIGYVRCNCITGVPNDKPNKWIAVPYPRYVGSIKLAARDIPEPRWDELPLPSLGGAWELVFGCLDGKSVGLACMVCREWRRACRNMPHYVDLLCMNRVGDFEAHDGAVYGIIVRGSLIFTTGSKEVKVWRTLENQDEPRRTTTRDESSLPFSTTTPNENIILHVSTPIRDTAVITAIRLSDNNKLYTATSNGAIREWHLPDQLGNEHHNHEHNNNDKNKNTTTTIPHRGTMWDHSSAINDVILSHPPPHADDAPCRRHGIANHTCLLYTCGDDRTVMMWDTVTRDRVERIECGSIREMERCCTVTSLCLGVRHLFVGCSIGRIVVFPCEAYKCERRDRHVCLMRPRRFCVQTVLRHDEGEEEEGAIEVLKLGGKYFSATFLFSGSENGSVNVFRLPDYGFEFELVTVLRKHERAITSIEFTWSHIYTASDDEKVNIWCLTTFALQRRLDCQSPVKCIQIDNSATPAHENRNLYAGLANGHVQTWNLGLWM